MIKLCHSMLASVGYLLIAASVARCAHSAEISFTASPAHEVRYSSGSTVYVESLQRGRFVARYWSTDGHIDPAKFWDVDDAFEIRVKNKPTPPTVPGTLLSMGWQWVSSSELPGSRQGTHEIVVELFNLIYPVDLKIHTLLDGTPVLTRWLEITNKSSEPIALTALSPWSGRLWSKDAPISLGHSVKWEVRWEGWFGWTALKPGLNVFKQDRGLAWDDPYFVLRNESNGEYFFSELGWPANYHMDFHKGPGGISFSIGPSAFNVLRVIDPEESIQTPAVHLGPVKGDFDDAVQAMHDHIRKSVLPTRDPKRRYMIQYLIPEDWPMTVYRGENYNEANMKKCMDVAAAAGMEVFILDGPMWGSTYGDWLTPSKERFPHGLQPLVDYAHEKGLLFGLYVEPEGGRGGYCSAEGGACIADWRQSQVYQEHPDWFVQPRSILNLSIPAAGAYFDSELSKIVDHYHIDLYRHDFNSPFRGRGSETLRDGFLESDYWRHYHAFYAAFKDLHRRYPDLILQQASGGGSRLELDTVSVFDEHFTSDRATYPFMYRMLSGLSVYLPPEILVGSNGMALPKDLPDLDTILRGAYALGTTPVIFNGILPRSVEQFKRGVREKFRHYAQLYKTFIRPLLPNCKVFHLAPVNATGGVESGQWLAMDFMAPDKKKGWAIVIRLKPVTQTTYVLKPKGLDQTKKYEVTFDNTGKTSEVDAVSMMTAGVQIHLEKGQASELLLFRQTR